MQQLTIYSQKDLDLVTPICTIADELRKLKKQVLCFTPWAAYPYKPVVEFAISYNQNFILLQYLVKEDFIKAAHGKINEPVYQDSCVEFFVSFDNSSYYNFEFNCIGAVLAGYGKEREHRQFLPEDLLREISSQIIIRNDSNQYLVCWELTIAIPLKTFLYNTIPSLQGQQCKANFYKCGNMLPEPHFLSWTDIKSKEPDFHLPDFFGSLVFK